MGLFPGLVPESSLKPEKIPLPNLATLSPRQGGFPATRWFQQDPPIPPPSREVRDINHRVGASGNCSQLPCPGPAEPSGKKREMVTHVTSASYLPLSLCPFEGNSKMPNL